MNASDLPRMDRRTAMKWMLTAAASLSLAPRWSFGSVETAAPVFATGYGRDANLLKSYQPGDFWPLTLTEAQRRTVAALCDTIVPADASSPAASAVGVHDFIDEWISAPYPDNAADRRVVLDGLAWIEGESQRRFGQSFAGAIQRQRNALCDDICHEPDAKPERKDAARFFDRFRLLTLGGFYTTPEGMKDVGYIGNVPLPRFEGAPPDLIAKLGLA